MFGPILHESMPNGRLCLKFECRIDSRFQVSRVIDLLLHNDRNNKSCDVHRLLGEPHLVVFQSRSFFFSLQLLS